MKKLLAICSIFFTVCMTFTACGSGDEDYMSNGDRSEASSDVYTTDDRDSVGDYVDDAIRGAGEAGGELIEGVTDAAGEIVNGLDPDTDRATGRSNGSRATDVTTAKKRTTTALTTTTKSYLTDADER